MTALTNWVLQRRSAAILITIIVLFFGIFAVTQLKSEMIPDLDLPYIAVSTVYPGANSDDVTDQVSIPIEGVITQVPKLKSVRTVSQESFSLAVAEFEFGTNMKDVEQSINSKLKTITLPNGANGSPLQPSIVNFNLNSVPILYVTLSGLKGQSTEEITKFAHDVVEPNFTKLTDVSNIQIVGGTSKITTINFRPLDMAAKGISVNDVANVLKANNLSYPVGSVDIAGQTISTRTFYTFSSPDDIANLIITSSSAAKQGQEPVHLKDVADVKLVDSQTGGISRTNGNPGVQVQVYKTQSGNTVTVSDGTLAKINELNQKYPDIKLEAVYDQANAVRKSIEGLAREGLLGAFFAILVIFLFLRNLRSTLVTAISIPTSVVVAFLLLWNQGITLNIMTLGGLAVAVGRVVDDAIVVLENIFRHAQEGEPVMVAVRNGTKEVAGAITSSTLTTVAVFLPLGFVGGLTGQFFMPFALTVTFALLASLVVALTIIPVFASYFINHKSVGDEKENTLLQRLYTPGLKWSLKHRWLTLLFATILLVFSVASVGIFKVPVAFLPESGDKLLTVTINTAPGTDQAGIITVAQNVEKAMDEYKQQGTVNMYQTTIYGDNATARSQKAMGAGGGNASMIVRLDSSANTNDVAKDMRAKLQPLFPKGGSITVASATSMSSNSYSLIIQGPNPDTVRETSAMIQDAIKNVDNLANISSDVSNLTTQVVVTPDPTKYAQANTAVIGTQLRNLLQGQSGGTIRFSDGTTTDILLLLPKLSGQSVDEYINNIKQVPIAVGVKVGDVAKVEMIRASNQTTRINQALAATVKADITSDDTAGVTREIQKKIDALKLPEGVTLSLSGISQQQKDAFTGMFLAMVGAIALVYVILVITFGSLSEPFAILFSLPLAAIGALLALVVTHRALGLPSMIGMLMLIGIVVTNAIVLVDLVKQLRRQGMEPNDALVQAGRTRLRPILMTAVATILALTPLALGLSEGSIIAAELGTVVIGGLLTSTFLTLVVVPVVYSLLDGGKTRITRFFKGGKGKKGDEKPDTSLKEEAQPVG